MDITEVLEKKEQQHLIDHLSSSLILKEQLESLDWNELDKAFEQCLEKHSSVDLDNYEPATYFPLKPTSAEQQELYKEAIAVGIEAISNGKVAAFTVAGGQGTRLGFDGPKGTLPVTPVKQKSLFQLFAEQIGVTAQRHNIDIPWYIMCSPLNHQATVDFFKANNFFGLSEKNVRFFTQGMMPVTDFSGKLLRKSLDQLATAPNGHGGSLKALIDSWSIADMKDRGIEHISYFQVDNPQVKILDPLFVGLHILQESDMSSRSLTKTGPFEKLGNFVTKDNRLHIVEYSDLPEEKAQEQTADGLLKYRAGSPAIHMIRRDFIEKFETADLTLPYHRAEKKVSYLNSNNEPVQPEESNAVKFETFIFDALPLAANALVLEASRDDFAPVKNKTGVDSLESCREARLSMFVSWLKEAGVAVPENVVVELSPLSFNSVEDVKARRADFVFQEGGSYYFD